MRRVKTFALTAVAAMTLVAVGAGTASATELYAITPGANPHETLPAGTVLTATLEPETTFSTTDTAGNPIETCTTGVIEGKISNAGSSTMTVTIPVSNVSIDGPDCNVTVDQTKNGTLEIHHIAGTTNGTLTGSGFHFSVHVFGTTCVYGLGETKRDLGELTGSTTGTGTLDINAVVPENTTPKFLCPDTTRWIAKYWVTNPDRLFVEAS
ncbi:MAG TPA: hypothetical protein VN733_06195 [Solirubrobacterales bacterium]|nr:hypothetical protein [Solirubrobacterales bacterium]